MKIELHVHTRFSKDSLLFLWALYLKCFLEGIDCIAITDHNTISGAERFKKFCEKRGNKIFVIVGEEISTDAGEVIGLYLTENIRSNMSPKETICEIRRQGGIVYVPHPYDLKRKKTVLEEWCMREYSELIDCAEVHNGRNVSCEYDKEQEKIVQKYGFVPIIGSDAHTYMELGRNYMEVMQRPIDAGTFRKVIRNAKFNTMSCLKGIHVITKIEKLIKLIVRGNFDEIYRIIIKKFKGREY